MTVGARIASVLDALDFARKRAACDGLCWRTMENDDGAVRACVCVCVSLARRARDAVSAVTYCPLSGNRECLSPLRSVKKLLAAARVSPRD